MAIAAQVITETEKPGTVLVRAFANQDRMGDARPIAGFFVRRRYHGDTFLLARPEEFSPTWMRFVNDPPAEWADQLKKVAKAHKVDLEDFTKPAETEMFAMSQVSDRDRGAQMNYSNGRVTPRKSA
jgi:hypothetical protein